jgi:hypothetical protein
MRQKIAKAVRRVEKVTGYTISLNKFILIRDDSRFRTIFGYFDDVNKHITIVNDQPESIIYHEIGHSYFNSLRLGFRSKKNALAVQFRNRFGFGSSYPKNYDPDTMINDQATRPEEDFCWCFAEIVSGESDKNSYPRVVRNKIRTVESIIRKAKLIYYS